MNMCVCVGKHTYIYILIHTYIFWLYHLENLGAVTLIAVKTPNTQILLPKTIVH